ncbi:hypothetical protein N1851_004576 [Merluccius polli]|uniref:Uncharacterized protein n=1 Tax=Merluccius polli TaxID=89951 RepID=A0AA47N8G5_MERPO|nr:hypothetical protein N1851_004576 [Merluccius polli]
MASWMLSWKILSFLVLITSVLMSISCSVRNTLIHNFSSTDIRAMVNLLGDEAARLTAVAYIAPLQEEQLWLVEDVHEDGQLSVHQRLQALLQSTSESQCAYAGLYDAAMLLLQPGTVQQTDTRLEELGHYGVILTRRVQVLTRRVQVLTRRVQVLTRRVQVLTCREVLFSENGELKKALMVSNTTWMMYFSKTGSVDEPIGKRRRVFSHEIQHGGEGGLIIVEDHNVIARIDDVCSGTRHVLMALLCWRQGGLLLHLVCSFVCSFVMASFESLFYVFHMWAKCANSLDMTRATNCKLRACKMNWRRMEQLVLTWLILSGQVIRCYAGGSINGGLLKYSWAELLGLQDSGVLPSPDLLHEVLGELRRHPEPGTQQGKKSRKRGRRGGIRHRIRGATKLPLPPMLLCNPRSLKNKLDDLRQQEVEVLDVSPVGGQAVDEVTQHTLRDLTAQLGTVSPGLENRVSPGLENRVTREQSRYPRVEEEVEVLVEQGLVLLVPHAEPLQEEMSVADYLLHLHVILQGERQVEGGADFVIGHRQVGGGADLVIGHLQVGGGADLVIGHLQVGGGADFVIGHRQVEGGSDLVIGHLQIGGGADLVIGHLQLGGGAYLVIGHLQVGGGAYLAVGHLQAGGGAYLVIGHLQVGGGAYIVVGHLQFRLLHQRSQSVQISFNQLVVLYILGGVQDLLSLAEVFEEELQGSGHQGGVAVHGEVDEDPEEHPPSLVIHLQDRVVGGVVGPAVNDAQQGPGQTQQFKETVEAKVDEMSGQTHHLERKETHHGRESCSTWFRYSSMNTMVLEKRFFLLSRLSSMLES